MEDMTVHAARALLMDETEGLQAPLAADGQAEAADIAGNGETTQASGEGGVPGSTGDAALEAARDADGAESAGAADADGSAAQSGGLSAMSADADGEQHSYVEGAVGLGVDIVEIERMKGILERQPNFAVQVFSADERAYCDSTANPATHYALRFAAKEAVVKALGTGFADGIWVHDIEVERNKKGRPSVKLSGRALEVAREQGVRDLSLSMSYTRTDAVACAMAVTESSVRASEKRKDPMEELARQFKETRKMLDDL